MADTVVQTGKVEIEFDDRKVEAGLDALVAKTRRDMAAIGREKAVVDVKYNVEDAKKALADVRAREKELAAEVKARQQILKDAEGRERGLATIELNRAAAKLDSQRRINTVYQRYYDQLTDLYKLEGRRQQQQRISDRDTQARLRMQKAENEADLRKYEQDQRALGLQKQYIAAKERAIELAKVERRLSGAGSDQQRASLDTHKAISDMVVLREKLRVMGEKPIPIKTKVDQPLLRKVGDLFGFTQENNIKDFSSRLADVAKHAREARLNIGPLSLSVQGLVLILGSLAPVITGLIGALGGLISVLGSGLAGALGVAAAGAAGFGLAAVGMFSALRSNIQQFGIAHQAIQKYQLAQAKYTANSKQGQRATQIFNHEIAQLPPVVRGAVKAMFELSTQWHKLTQATADKALGQGVAATLKTVKADMGFFAKDTNQALLAVASGWSNLMAQFRSRDAQHGLDTVFKNFNKTIPTLFSALGKLLDVTGRVVENFSTHLPGLSQGLLKWATGLDNSAKKSGGFKNGVNQAVTSMQKLGHFTEAATRFLITFFQAGVKPGQSFVDDMTKGLNRLNTQMSTATGQQKLTNFFSRSIKTTKELWNALLPLVSAFVQFAQAMAPVATVGLQIVSWFTRFVAAAAAFKPLRYFAGFLVGLSIIGRMTSGIREMVGLIDTLGTRLAAMSRMEGGIFSIKNFRATGNTAQAAKMVEEGTVAGFRQGAAITEAAIVAGFERGAKVGGAIIAADEVGGAKTGGAIIAEEEATGGALGGLGPSGRVGKIAGEGEKAVGKLGGLASKAGRAFGIGGIGILGSQLVGGAIGGKAGSAVSNIGSLASTGAALGSFLGPEGTVAGAFAGALVGGLTTFVHDHTVEDMANKFAKDFTKPLGTDVGRPAAARLSKEVQDAKNFDQGIAGAHGRSTGGIPAAVPGLNPAQQKESDAKWAKAGRDAANTFIKDFSHAKVPSAFLFVQDAERQLAAMRPRMRASGAAAILEYAQGMVSKHQMTVRQFGDLMRKLEAQYPSFRAYLKKNGITTANEFAANMKFTKARNTLATSIQNFRDDFKDYNIDPNVTGKNLVKNVGRAMKDLKHIMATGTKEQRQAAKAEYDKLKAQTATTFQDMLDNTNTKIKNIRKVLAQGSGQAVREVTGNFLGLAKNVNIAMVSGAMSVSDGINIIVKSLNAALSALGGTPLSKTAVYLANAQGPKGLSNSLQESIAGINEQGIVAPHATGGRVPGPVGPDNWTLVDPNGNAAAMVGGSEILVANRHTERRVDSMLAPYGTSLGEQVAGEHKPHSYATGGRIQKYGGGGIVTASEFGGPGDPGTGSTGYKGDNLYAHPDSFAELNMGTALGHLPYMAPVTVTHRGKTARLFKRDIGAGGPGMNGHVRAIDLWFQAAQALGLSGLDDVTVNGGAGVNVVISGGGGGSAIPTLQPPKVRGKGANAAITRAGLKKVTDAANKYLQAHAPRPSAGGGALTTGYQGPQGAGHFDGLEVADWIVPILNWARGHGWSGHITSGYRPGAITTSGNRSNHASLNYPGGAVDVGDKTAAAAGLALWNVVKNYPGTPKLYSAAYGPGAWGPYDGSPHDYGHFSATGHARGGRVKYAGAFAGGGAFTAMQPTMAMFGEAGPETVVAIPHATRGHRGISRRPTTHTRTLPGGGRSETDYSPTVLPSHPRSGLFLLKKRDYIGGVPTDDLDQAVTDAQHVFGDRWTKIHQPHTETVKVPHVTITGGHDVTRTDYRGRTTKTRVGSHTTRSWSTHQVKVGGSPEHDLKSKDPKVRAAAKKQLDDAHKLYLRWKKLEKMDKEAKEYAASFANLETQMSTVGTYMDSASSSKDDMAWGFDRRGNKVHRTWGQWKKELVTLERDHVHKLRIASRDIHKLARGDDRASTVAIVRAIDSALATANQDMATAQGTTDAGHPSIAEASGTDDFIAAQDPTTARALRSQLDRLNYAFSLAPEGSTAQQGVAKSLWDYYRGLFALGRREQPRNYPLLTALHDAETAAQQTYEGITPLTGASATSPEDYMSLLQGGSTTGVYSNQLGALNYAFSVAQGNNIPDDPATAAREDLDTLKDDLSAAAGLKDFYANLFTTAKSDPKTAGNYGLLTSLSDAFNAAQSTWQGIQQQFTDAATQIGPTQGGLAAGAQAALYATYSGNIAPLLAPVGLGGAAAVNPTLQGAAVTGPSSMVRTGAAGAGDTHVHMTNHFPTPPSDPHSWSKGVAWEMQHAI